MLKVKEGIKLEELKEKYDGWIEFEENSDNMDFNINPKTREVCINCWDSYYSSEVNERAELLYDLITAGIVVKE